MDIFPIFWPAFSSDLDRLEGIWNKMENFIQPYYAGLRNGRLCPFDELREIVAEARDSITPQEL